MPRLVRLAQPLRLARLVRQAATVVRHAATEDAYPLLLLWLLRVVAFPEALLRLRRGLADRDDEWFSELHFEASASAGFGFLYRHSLKKEF